MSTLGGEQGIEEREYGLMGTSYIVLERRRFSNIIPVTGDRFKQNF